MTSRTTTKVMAGAHAPLPIRSDISSDVLINAKIFEVFLGCHVMMKCLAGITGATQANIISNYDVRARI